MSVLKTTPGVLVWFVFIQTAFAQPPLPDPMDVIGIQGLGPEGPCGGPYETNRVADEVQRLYHREDRCDEYGDGALLYNPYKAWIRAFDPDEKDFWGEDPNDPEGYETLGNYETVNNYFYYYGLDWWDGKYTKGYRERAAKAGQPRVPAPTSRHARYGYEKAPSEMAGQRSRNASPGERLARRSQGEEICGQVAEDRTEETILLLFERRRQCDRYDPATYDQFKDEVPESHRYAINYISWMTGQELYPPEEARRIDEEGDPRER